MIYIRYAQKMDISRFFLIDNIILIIIIIFVFPFTLSRLYFCFNGRRFSKPKKTLCFSGDGGSIGVELISSLPSAPLRFPPLPCENGYLSLLSDMWNLYSNSLYFPLNLGNCLIMCCVIRLAFSDWGNIG